MANSSYVRMLSKIYYESFLKSIHMRSNEKHLKIQQLKNVKDIFCL